MTEEKYKGLVADLEVGYLQRKECWKCVFYTICPIIDKLHKLTLSFQKEHFRLNDMAILCNNYKLDQKKVDGVENYLQRVKE